jgi:hypothetical protein
VEELRTLPAKERNTVFSICDLFDDVSSVNSNCVNVLANRPLRARQKKHPEESLTLENFREAQLTDNDIFRFLK